MKIIFHVSLLAYQLLAFDNQTASQIFDKIFHALVKKEQIKIYTQNTTYKDVISLSNRLVLSSDSKTADIILVNSLDEVPQESRGRLLFTTSYLVFKENKDAVGAFYWDRGHIKIEFSKKRLDVKNIKLSKQFQKYIKKNR